MQHYLICNTNNEVIYYISGQHFWGFVFLLPFLFTRLIKFIFLSVLQWTKSIALNLVFKTIVYNSNVQTNTWTLVQCFSVIFLKISAVL